MRARRKRDWQPWLVLGLLTGSVLLVVCCGVGILVVLFS
jgi:hypothetical protein